MSEVTPLVTIDIQTPVSLGSAYLFKVHVSNCSSQTREHHLTNLVITMSYRIVF